MEKRPITTGIILIIVSLFIAWLWLFLLTYVVGCLFVMYGLIKKFW